MMENLDKARAREAKKFSEAAAASVPVEVYSLSDIKRVVGELDPAKNPKAQNIELKTLLRDGDETYEVKASTKSKSKRDMLIEGIDIIRRRLEAHENLAGEEVEINGKMMKPKPIGNGVEGRSWVDPLINQWTGGYRDGINICWDLNGVHYKYDIYSHKLTRKKNDG